MNFVITARNNKTGNVAYIKSTRFSESTEDLNEAARFVQDKSAIQVIKDLIVIRDYENANGVKLGYASVKLVIEKEFEIKQKAAKSGFIIQVGDKFSNAPRKPTKLELTHVSYTIPNAASATRFLSRAEAQKRIDDSIELLKKANRFDTSPYHTSAVKILEV